MKTSNHLNESEFLGHVKKLNSVLTEINKFLGNNPNIFYENLEDVIEEEARKALGNGWARKIKNIIKALERSLPKPESE